jgi:hypothetical protein
MLGIQKTVHLHLTHGFEEDEEAKIEYTIVQRGRKRSILIICPAQRKQEDSLRKTV